MESSRGRDSPGVASPIPATPVASPVVASAPVSSTPVAAADGPEAAGTDKNSLPAENTVVGNTKLSESTPVQSPKRTSLVDYPSFNKSKECDSEDNFDDKIEKASEEEDAASEYSSIKWPPPDVQMVIDKMASYIIKNGPEFETMVCARGKGPHSDFRFCSAVSVCVYICLENDDVFILRGLFIYLFIVLLASAV